MMNEYGTISPAGSNLKEKRHRSICLPVCFSGPTHPFDVLDDDDYVRTPRSPKMPEIRDRCRNLISKIGGHRRSRAASADFSYEAYNYALNFEDDTTRADDIILRSRLPPSASGSLTPPEKSTTSGIFWTMFWRKMRITGAGDDRRRKRSRRAGTRCRESDCGDGTATRPRRPTSATSRPATRLISKTIAARPMSLMDSWRVCRTRRRVKGRRQRNRLRSVRRCARKLRPSAESTPFNSI